MEGPGLLAEPITFSCQFLDASVKAVSASRRRLDVLPSFAALTERPAEGGHIHRQLGLFHKRVRPDRLHQTVFRHQTAAVLNQDGENLKRLWGDGNGFAVAEQGALPRSRVGTVRNSTSALFRGS